MSLYAQARALRRMLRGPQGAGRRPRAEAFRLCAVEGLTAKEAGACVGESANTISTRVRRARLAFEALQLTFAERDERELGPGEGRVEQDQEPDECELRSDVTHDCAQAFRFGRSSRTVDGSSVMRVPSGLRCERADHER